MALQLNLPGANLNYEDALKLAAERAGKSPDEYLASLPTNDEMAARGRKIAAAYDVDHPDET